MPNCSATPERVGIDVYNLFNNDAVRTYQDSFDVADYPASLSSGGRRQDC